MACLHLSNIPFLETVSHPIVIYIGLACLYKKTIGNTNQEVIMLYSIYRQIRVAAMLAILYATANAQEAAPVIRNADSAWGKTPRVTLKPIGHLGEIDGENEDYLFYRPEDIAADSQGNLYVADAGNKVIKKFDAQGRFLLSFGHSGQGPGEFSYPGCISVSPDDELYIGDWQNQRIQVFSAQGEYLDVIPLKTSNIEFRVRKDGRILLRNPGLDGGYGLKEGDVPLFRLITPEGQRINTFGQGRYFTQFPFSQGGNRCLIASDEADNAYAVFLFQNRISKYDNEGRLLFTASRPVPKDKLLNKALDTYSTLSAGVDVDDQGRIWIASATRKWRKEDQIQRSMTTTADGKIETHIKDANAMKHDTDLYALELFSPTGELLYRYPLTHYVDGVRVIGNRLYLVDRDRSMRFYLYEIQES